MAHPAPSAIGPALAPRVLEIVHQLPPPLHQACSAGNLGLVKEILMEMSDPNLPDQSGQRPLHYAVKSNQKEIVDFLLLNGADVNGKDSNGFSAMHLAASGGNEILMERLLKARADVDICDIDKNRPLHLAAANGHASAVKFLLKNKSNPLKVNSANSSPIHSAHNGHYSLYRDQNRLQAIENALYKAGAKKFPNHDLNTGTQYERVLGNINGIKDRNSAHFEGLDPDYPLYKHVADSLEQMPWESDAFSSADLREACLLIDSNVDRVDQYEVETLARIKAGKLTFIKTGWAGHCVYLVFFKGYMAICNRGQRPCIQTANRFKWHKSYFPVNEVFKINANNLSLMDVNLFRTSSDLSAKEGMTYFYQELPRSLSGKKDNISIQFTKALANSDQKAGNCPLNIKPALRIGAALVAVVGNGRPIDEGISQAYQFSKKWSTYFRMISLNSYLNDEQRALHFENYDAYKRERLEIRPGKRDPKLIRQIQAKIAKRQAKPLAHVAPTDTLLQFS